jgi:hypothetical protein
VPRHQFAQLLGPGSTQRRRFRGGALALGHMDQVDGHHGGAQDRHRRQAARERTREDAHLHHSRLDPRPAPGRVPVGDSTRSGVFLPIWEMSPPGPLARMLIGAVPAALRLPVLRAGRRSVMWPRFGKKPRGRRIRPSCTYMSTKRRRPRGTPRGRHLQLGSRPG